MSGVAATGLKSAPPANLPPWVVAAIAAAPPPPFVPQPEPLTRPPDRMPPPDLMSELKEREVELEPAPSGSLPLDMTPEEPRHSTQPITVSHPEKTEVEISPLFSHHHTKRPHEPETKDFEVEDDYGLPLHESALVDRNVVAAVTAELVGKERTGTSGKATMSTAVALSRKYHSNLTGITGIRLAESIAHSAAAAFVEGVPAELRAAQHILAAQEAHGEVLALYRAGTRPPPGMRCKIRIRKWFAWANAWYWARQAVFMFLAYVPLIITTIWAVSPPLMQTTCPMPVFQEEYSPVHNIPEEYTWQGWVAQLPTKLLAHKQAAKRTILALSDYYPKYWRWWTHSTLVDWHLQEPCPRVINIACLAFIALWTVLVISSWTAWRWYNSVTDPDQVAINAASERFNDEDLGTSFPQGVYQGKLAILKKEYAEIVATVPALTKKGTTDVGRQAFIGHWSLVPHKIFPFVPNSSGRNELVCVEKRLCGHPLTGDPGDLLAFDKFIPDFLNFMFPDLNGCPKCQYAREAGLEGDPHEAVYQEWNSPSRVGTAMAKLHDKDRRRQQAGMRDAGDFDVSCFVKAEPCFASDDTEKFEPSAPRPIQNASGAAHVSLGPYMYAFSKLMAKRMSKDAWITYASGISVQDASDCCKGAKMVYVGDVSRFDRGLQHQNLVSLNDWRNSHNMFSHTPRQFVDSQLNTKGRTMKGRHIYRLRGQRRSGDDNTSVDNSLFNVMAHVHAIMLHTGKTLEQVSKLYKILMLGDDIVILGPRELESVDFKRILAGIAWMIKPAFTDREDTIEFCSRINWPSSAGHTFGTKAGRFFARFGYSWDAESLIDIGSKAYGLLLLNNHVPFVGPFLRTVIALHGKGTKPWALPEWSMKHPEVMAEATADTWSAFTARYGLDRDDETSFMRTLSTWRGGPGIISHPAIDKLLAVDGYPG